MYQELGLCPKTIIGPQFHIEDALSWNCTQLEKVGTSRNVQLAKITWWFKNFVQKIWMNFSKHFQEVSTFEQKMCYIWTNLWSCVKLRKLRLSNIIPPPTKTLQFEVVIQKIRTNTYKLKTCASYMSSLRIPHRLWTSRGKELNFEIFQPMQYAIGTL